MLLKLTLFLQFTMFTMFTEQVFFHYFQRSNVQMDMSFLCKMQNYLMCMTSVRLAQTLVYSHDACHICVSTVSGVKCSGLELSSYQLHVSYYTLQKAQKVNKQPFLPVWPAEFTLATETYINTVLFNWR